MSLFLDSSKRAFPSLKSIRQRSLPYRAPFLHAPSRPFRLPSSLNDRFLEPFFPRPRRRRFLVSSLSPTSSLLSEVPFFQCVVYPLPSSPPFPRKSAVGNVFMKDPEPPLHPSPFFSGPVRLPERAGRESSLLNQLFPSSSSPRDDAVVGE